MGNNATIVLDSMVDSVIAGDLVTITVTCTNTGTTTWTPSTYHCRLHYRDLNNYVHNYIVGGFELLGEVAPEATVQFTLTTIRPVNGKLQVQMVEELVEWFGDINNIPLIDLYGIIPRQSYSISGVCNVPISAGADDCYVCPRDSAIDLTELILMGAVDTPQNAGFRWVNVTVPKNATIKKAYIVFTAGDDNFNEVCSLSIKGEAADNPITFSTYEDFAARPFTTASVPFIVPTVLNEGTYNSPELKTVIQEIVSRSGWVSGNAITIFCNDDASTAYAVRTIRNYDGFPAQTAVLHIEYEYTPSVIYGNEINGVFTTVDEKTITVVNGQITSITP